MPVLTRSRYTGGYNDFTCPEKPTYDTEGIRGRSCPVAEGTSRMVLTGAYDADRADTTDADDRECPA